MAQVAREKALTRFREGKLQVLVATDVAARGIDVTGVTHVVNYTCPEDEKTYVHRIGRTGRAGATGIAITFVDWADLHRWKMINKALDLPFDEPQETYSSSEHFFHDQGIPAGTKGRIVARGPGRAPSPQADDGSTGGSATAPRAQAIAARTRGGQQVAAGAAAATASASHGSRATRDRQRRASGRAARNRVVVAAAPARPARGPASRRPEPRLARAQAMTTTLVPTGAKSHSALASGATAGCSRATAACRAARRSAAGRRSWSGCCGSRSPRRSGRG